jgi:hypothetical protein
MPFPWEIPNVHPDEFFNFQSSDCDMTDTTERLLPQATQNFTRNENAAITDWSWLTEPNSAPAHGFLESAEPSHAAFENPATAPNAGNIATEVEVELRLDKLRDEMRCQLNHFKDEVLSRMNQLEVVLIQKMDGLGKELGSRIIDTEDISTRYVTKNQVF